MYKLKIINSTTREGRKGPIIAEWIAEKARETGNFEVEIIDLGDIDLPLMVEANHPRMQQYESESTKAWSAKIDEADAFIFVTAEYNYSYPAPLKNALDYLAFEWNYKAAGIVSYGGVSAGTRAANQLKGDLPTYKVVPIPEAVHIPFYSQFINEKEELVGNEIMDQSANALLQELSRWSKGLKVVKDNVLEAI